MVLMAWLIAPVLYVTASGISTWSTVEVIGNLDINGTPFPFEIEVEVPMEIRVGLHLWHRGSWSEEELAR